MMKQNVSNVRGGRRKKLRTCTPRELICGDPRYTTHVIEGVIGYS
jgi:hypothetical protein